MANSVDPDQNAPIGAVCSGSTLCASILNLSVLLGNYLQQTTPADDIFRCIFLGALRAKKTQILEPSGLVSQLLSRINFVLSWVEYGKSCITSGHGRWVYRQTLYHVALSHLLGTSSVIYTKTL